MSRTGTGAAGTKTWSVPVCRGSYLRLLAEIALEHRRVAHHFGRRDARDYFAAVEHSYVLGERHHGAHDMLDQQDGDAVGAVEAAEHLDHLVALGRPQPRHHLVEEE